MIHRLKLHRYHWISLALLALAGLAMLFAYAPKAHSTVAILDTHEHIQSLAKAEELLKAMEWICWASKRPSSSPPPLRR
jgi:hypothetical protein